MFRTMSFKETSAWIMMTICVVAGAAYAAICVGHHVETGEWIIPIAPFAVLTVIMIILSVPAHILAAIVKRDTANDPADERDDFIRYKAGFMSGNLLGLLLLLTLILFVLNTNAFLLFHVVMSCLVISQIVEYGLQIAAYRTMSAMGDA